MLAQSHRFHGLSALRPLQRSGRIARGKNISLRFQARTDNSHRVAVVVSKKVHKSAVVRNRIRRRIYECVRTGESTLIQGLDVALYVYSVDFAAMPYPMLTKQIENVLLKARADVGAPTKHAIVETEEN